jgi:Arm domain-containing DNA-binding protein
MARQLKRLTARTVATMKMLGRHADGGNLYLTISKTGAGVSRRWTFLFSLNGRQREAGFGSAATVTLAEARERAGRNGAQRSMSIACLFSISRSIR